MNRTVISSLLLGWLGSFTSWVTAAYPLLSVMATGLASMASVYAIVVANRTAQLRRLQIQEATRMMQKRLRPVPRTHPQKKSKS